MKRRFKLNFLSILFVILLLLVSGCSNAVPHNRFTQDEQIAYDFLTNVYSDNQYKSHMAIIKWVSKNNNSIMIMNQKLADKEFLMPHFQSVEIIRSAKIDEYGRHVDLILAKISSKKLTRENIVYMTNHRVLLNIMPNDSIDKQDFDRLLEVFSNS